MGFIYFLIFNISVSINGAEYLYIMNEQILICYRGGLVESKNFF